MNAAPRKSLGAELRAQDSNGVTWPSLRMPGGLCLAAFWPDGVGIPVQGSHYCCHWDGKAVDYVQQRDKGVVLRVV